MSILTMERRFSAHGEVDCEASISREARPSLGCCGDVVILVVFCCIAACG